MTFFIAILAYFIKFNIRTTYLFDGINEIDVIILSIIITKYLIPTSSTLNEKGILKCNPAELLGRA